MCFRKKLTIMNNTNTPCNIHVKSLKNEKENPPPSCQMPRLDKAERFVVLQVNAQRKDLV